MKPDPETIFEKNRARIHKGHPYLFCLIFDDLIFNYMRHIITMTLPEKYCTKYRFSRDFGSGFPGWDPSTWSCLCIMPISSSSSLEMSRTAPLLCNINGLDSRRSDPDTCLNENPFFPKRKKDDRNKEFRIQRNFF